MAILCILLARLLFSNNLFARASYQTVKLLGTGEINFENKKLSDSPFGFTVLEEKGGDMMIRKDLVIAILATFCLTSVLFLIPASSSGIWPYDPWWDINDDGKIDIQDLARVSGAFGTYGTNRNTIKTANTFFTLLYPYRYFPQNLSANPLFFSDFYFKLWKFCSRTRLCSSLFFTVRREVLTAPKEAY